MGQPEAITREQVAAAYRAVNQKHKPYYEGSREFWATATVGQIAGWADDAVQAVKLDRQWRKESGVGSVCVYGSRGCPPYAFRDCEGEHGPSEGAKSQGKGNVGAKQASLDMSGSSR